MLFRIPFNYGCTGIRQVQCQVLKRGVAYSPIGAANSWKQAGSTAAAGVAWNRSIIPRQHDWNNRQSQLLTCASHFSNPLYTSVRLNHTGDNDQLQGQGGSLPALMPFPPIIWPRFMNAIRNWFFITFIIKPYFDQEFSMQEFLDGAREAVSVVSNKLSEGKLDDLDGLVDPSALAQIKESLSKFTVFQQQLLRVAVEDIFFSFPYQVGIIIPDETTDRYLEGVKPPPQKRHVEITVSLHVLRGLAEKKRTGEVGGAFNFQEFAQDERNKYHVMICNYRFFKDFTEGSSDPSWIINMVNHFLPMELAAMRK